MTKIDLFSGVPIKPDGLSNEKELAEACPEEFKNENWWSEYVTKLSSQGGGITNWKWKSSDEAEQERQRICLDAILYTPGLSSSERKAVACWMLSEMLAEVPEYLPLKLSDFGH